VVPDLLFYVPIVKKSDEIHHPLHPHVDVLEVALPVLAVERLVSASVGGVIQVRRDFCVEMEPSPSTDEIGVVDRGRSGHRARGSCVNMA